VSKLAPNFIKSQGPSNKTCCGLQEEYDVYVYEPEPLEAGESKHILSVFVADESGMINRICGVFARRGKSRYLQSLKTKTLQMVVSEWILATLQEPT